MKIFLSFLQSNKNHSIPAYSFWEHYIKNGIEESGHEWTECPGADWALGLVAQAKTDQLKWKQEIWGEAIDWLKKNPADIFLSYLHPAQIDVSAIKEIQKSGIPCINFFCDNVRDFKNLPDEFNIFDLNWVPEYKAVKMYKKAGYPYINLPMPMWVEPQYRILREETNHQITFIGSSDIQRLLLFKEIVNKDPDLPLAIYGKGWKDVNNPLQLPDTPGYTFDKKLTFNLNVIMKNGLIPYLRKVEQRNIDTTINIQLSKKTYASPAFEDYNRLIAESMITLGVNRYPSFQFPVSRPDSYSRLRDIEAPMLGACYLTEYTDGIEDLYDIDNEIVVYRTADELIYKSKRLQQDFNWRKKLKINGQKKSLNDHSVPNSLIKVIQKVMH